jgi:hypothetical protein
MNTRTATTSTAANRSSRSGRSVADCRATAQVRLASLIGAQLDDLVWDDTYPLRGHGHIAGCALVVIAPRDPDHVTVVLTAQDWDAVRMASADDRRDLLATSSIADHEGLVARLGVVAESTHCLPHAA